MKLSRVSSSYYQEVARELAKTPCNFGWIVFLMAHARITTRIDTFWLDNSLKVTPDEELGLVKRLYFRQLPFFDTL